MAVATPCNQKSSFLRRISEMWNFYESFSETLSHIRKLPRRAMCIYVECIKIHSSMRGTWQIRLELRRVECDSNVQLSLYYLWSCMMWILKFSFPPTSSFLACKTEWKGTKNDCAINRENCQLWQSMNREFNIYEYFNFILACLLP